ncbi:group 3 secretory phospholipase A2-like [Salarias fasciatus]|uniref:group 3 secretory phospholipase A2-like n=1 Tax=Salarias fasciatus TaxID=181472 RepID=UPI001176DB62|nr:group 3 secretory phospholipase A2-like [Salarias fasciatus]
MRSRCLLQVASVLSSLFLTKAHDVSGTGVSCIRSSPAGGQTRVSFVRQDRSGARSLLLTLWSEDAELLACEVHSDPRVTESYAKICEKNDTRGQEVFWKFNLSVLQAPDGPCSPASRSAPGTGGAEGNRRRKRAWIFPGTLWCGSGSKAGGYDQLGMFESADRCCREHDHCRHIIPAFTVNYGVFNSNVFTVSHCECDQRFRECLLGVNDSISSMVGYSFFNILQVPCFELRQQRRCTEMYWFGMCKVAGVAPYAVFKNPLPFNTSDSTATSKPPDAENNQGQLVTKSPTINPRRKSPKAQVRCDSRDPPRGDTFHRRTSKGKGCRRRQNLSKAAPSEMRPASRTPSTTERMKTDILNAFKSNSSLSNKKTAGRRNKIISKKSEISSTKPPNTLPVTPHLHPTTAVVSLAKSNNKRKKAPKQNDCCGPRIPAGGETIQLHCKSCHEQENLSHQMTATQEKSAVNGFQAKLATLENLHLKKKAETSKRHSLTILSDAVITAVPVTTNSPESPDRKSKQENRLKPFVKEEPASSDTAQSTHTATSLHQNNAPPNKTDHKHWCESLKILDECKFKIPPWENKYELQNWESKTAYHCDCTARLALELERLEQPSIVPRLLVDFVSQQCFTLPKEKKCHHRKSCTGGFAKASDLHQALKKIEEKDTTGVQNSNKTRKRGIPVRLYKRCLRLRKEADLMAENR